MLIENGADVNAKDQYGITALMEASRNGHDDIVKRLIDNGADVDARDNESWSALLRASLAGHAEIQEILKKVGSKE